MRQLSERCIDILEILQHNNGLDMRELAVCINDDVLATQLSLQQLKKIDLVITDPHTGHLRIAQRGFEIWHVRCPVCKKEKRVPNNQVATHCIDKTCRVASGWVRIFSIVKLRRYAKGQIVRINRA